MGIHIEQRTNPLPSFANENNYLLDAQHDRHEDETNDNEEVAYGPKMVMSPFVQAMDFMAGTLLIMLKTTGPEEIQPTTKPTTAKSQISSKSLSSTYSSITDLTSSTVTSIAKSLDNLTYSTVSTLTDSFTNVSSLSSSLASLTTTNPNRPTMRYYPDTEQRRPTIITIDVPHKS